MYLYANWMSLKTSRIFQNMTNKNLSRKRKLLLRIIIAPSLATELYIGWRGNSMWPVGGTRVKSVRWDGDGLQRTGQGCSWLLIMNDCFHESYSFARQNKAVIVNCDSSSFHKIFISILQLYIYLHWLRNWTDLPHGVKCEPQGHWVNQPSVRFITGPQHRGGFGLKFL